jgi:Flp pilus assembly pilin Flp
MFRRIISLPGSLAIEDTGSAAIKYAILVSLIAMALVSVISGLGDYFSALSGYMAGELARAVALYFS